VKTKFQSDAKKLFEVPFFILMENEFESQIGLPFTLLEKLLEYAQDSVPKVSDVRANASGYLKAVAFPLLFRYLTGPASAPVLLLSLVGYFILLLDTLLRTKQPHKLEVRDVKQINRDANENMQNFLKGLDWQHKLIFDPSHYCFNCAEKSENLQPCGACLFQDLQSEHFLCSKECQKQAWKKHKKELKEKKFSKPIVRDTLKVAQPQKLIEEKTNGNDDSTAREKKVNEWKMTNGKRGERPSLTEILRLKEQKEREQKEHKKERKEN
jgi:hypothetical protein